MEKIRVEDLTFSYDKERNAVEAVSFAIEEGSYTTIIGHNGSGKSTIAKLLIGLLDKDQGHIYVDGEELTMDTLYDIRDKVGIVFQNPDNQIIASVVQEDVGFGPENIGVPTEEIWERVEKSLKAVGMWQYREHSPNKLSGGQKQRVAIAGVMAMEPKCIILDEPTAMLDPNGRKEVLEAVHALNREKGVTIILITHYMEEVVDADYVYVMDQGKVVLEGNPRGIFSQVETLKEHRLDVPQITLLAHELQKAGLAIPDGILTREELIDALQKVADKRK